MLFDVNLLFFHTGTVYAFTSGEYVSLSGALTASTSLQSSVINLGNARDMGIGDGEFAAHLALFAGTAITSACTSLTLNVQFQGSTDSVNWTTYEESGALSTASYLANSGIPMNHLNVPRRPPGVSLPLYYRINLATGLLVTNSISSGTIIGGIVINDADNAGTLDQYASGFSVA